MKLSSSSLTSNNIFLRYALSVSMHKQSEYIETESDGRDNTTTKNRAFEML